MLIINNIKKTHYAPKSTSEEKEGKLKYFTVKDAIFDLPIIRQVKEKNILNIILNIEIPFEKD